MMFVRFLMIATGLILLLTAGGVIAATPYWESMARDAIADRLGAALHTEASLGGLSLDVQQKAFVLQDLVIHNPPGFAPGEAVRAGKILLVVNPLTLFAEAPAITTLRVEDLSVGLCTKGGQDTNLAALAAACATDDTGAGAASSRGVQVGRIECSGVAFTLPGCLPPVQSPPAPVPAFALEGMAARGVLDTCAVVSAVLRAVAQPPKALVAITPAA